MTLLNVREPAAYQRDEINSLKSRVRLLEVQEFPFVRHRDFDAAGDLVVGTGDNTYDLLSVGANGTTVIADDAELMGMRWGAATDIAGFTEGVQDVVGLLFIDSTDLDLTYDDTLGTVSAVIKNDAVTNAKLANMTEATFKGRAAGAGTGDPIDLTAAQAATILSGALVVADITNFAEGVQDVVGAFFIDSADFDITYDDALNTITGIIKNDAVTNAKLANMAQATVKGRANAAGTGDPTDLTPAQVNAITALADEVTTFNRTAHQISAIGSTAHLAFYDRATSTGAGIWYSPSAGDLRLFYNADVLIYNADGLTLGGTPGVPTNGGIGGKHLYLTNPSDGTEWLGMGYNHANDAGFIYAVDSGVAWKNIALAPTGGTVSIGGWSVTDLLNVQGGGIWCYHNSGDYIAIRLRGAQGTHFTRFQGIGDGNGVHSAVVFQQVLPSGAGTPTYGKTYFQAAVAGSVENTIQMYNRTVDINNTGVGATLAVGSAAGKIANYTRSDTAGNTSDVIEQYDWSGSWDFYLNQEHISGSRIIYNWYHNYGGSHIPALTVDGWFTGLGTTRPLGRLHAVDGGGVRWLAVAKYGVDSTPQTIIPDGAGDVTVRLKVNLIWSDSAGASGEIASYAFVPGYLLGTFGFDVGNYCTLSCNANGSVTVVRTAGTRTYTLAMWLMWI